MCPTNPAFHYPSLPLHLTQLSAILSKGWSESDLFFFEKTCGIPEVRFLLVESRSSKALLYIVELGNLSHMIHRVSIHFNSVHPRWCRISVTISLNCGRLLFWKPHLQTDVSISGSKTKLIILPSETANLYDHLQKFNEIPFIEWLQEYPVSDVNSYQNTETHNYIYHHKPSCKP